MAEQATPEAIKTLYAMLQTMRPHGSKSEMEFSKKYLLPLGVRMDAFGNCIRRIGTAPIAWSSHVDTVHRLGGLQSITQDEDYNITLAKSSHSNCLGADDTAGVWLMMEMMKAKVPGLYIFHRGEECGGKGSDFISKSTKALVQGIDYMVAFDRKGYDSVITHQWGGRCCSDDFGKSLAAQLGEDYKLDKGGSFTDSANYTDLIGECTNVSIGYKNQHWKTEELNLPHLVMLRSSMIDLDISKLVSKRKPGEKEPVPIYKYSGGHNRQYDGYFCGGYWEGGKWKNCSKVEWDEMQKKKLPVVVKPARTERDLLFEYIYSNPGELADLLLDWGIDLEMTKEFVLDSKVRAMMALREQRGSNNPPKDKEDEGGAEPIIM